VQQRFCPSAGRRYSVRLRATVPQPKDGVFPWLLPGSAPYKNRQSGLGLILVAPVPTGGASSVVPGRRTLTTRHHNPMHGHSWGSNFPGDFQCWWRRLIVTARFSWFFQGRAPAADAAGPKLDDTAKSTIGDAQTFSLRVPSSFVWRTARPVGLCKAPALPTGSLFARQDVRSGG
jgi:hypothetical protein